MEIKFITPRDVNLEKADLLLSDHTLNIVRYYAEYAKHSTDDVVDIFLKNLLNDEEFIKWIKNKRNNKRIISQLKLEDLKVE